MRVFYAKVLENRSNDLEAGRVLHKLSCCIVHLYDYCRGETLCRRLCLICEITLDEVYFWIFKK